MLYIKKTPSYRTVILEAECSVVIVVEEGLVINGIVLKVRVGILFFLLLLLHLLYFTPLLGFGGRLPSLAPRLVPPSIPRASPSILKPDLDIAWSDSEGLGKSEARLERRDLFDGKVGLECLELTEGVLETIPSGAILLLLSLCDKTLTMDPSEILFRRSEGGPVAGLALRRVPVFHKAV